MRPGSSVKVKQGILDPGFREFDMSGWQGRVAGISHGGDETLVEIRWDSVTLKQMPEKFITGSIDDGGDYAVMFLSQDDVEPAAPRDADSDVEKTRSAIDDHYYYDNSYEKGKRIASILARQDLSVNYENQRIYFDYLQKHLHKPLLLTGSEDFPWEEKYLLGGWDKKEYEALKKTKPSYTDRFKFVELVPDIDDRYGILAKVERTTDRKTFTLPLWDLECVDAPPTTHRVISDYSYWMTNYG